jgi:pimeloyl-ACP methyl ester carboxylesterase
MTVTPGTSSATWVGPDGVPVGYRKIGAGKPLVIVHGSIATGEQWMSVAERLAADHTVYVLDRRGRGLSGDSVDYSLATEARDIGALVEIAGPGAALLGHSYGAVCALEAVRRGTPVESLILYEPPLPVDGPVAGEQLGPYEELLTVGDLDGAMRLACDHFLRITPEEKESLAASPMWDGMVELTPTWSRELEQIDLTVAELADYSALAVRTLLLVGGDSPGLLRNASSYLYGNMPDVGRSEFPGQNHFAHVMAPAALAGAVRDFLSPS